MSLNETLDNWFTYHPPTEETGPKYDALRHAEDVACAAIGTSHDTINAACRAFVEEIYRLCPPGADASAAVRCVRIARNAANEALVTGRLEQEGKPTGRISCSQLQDIAIVELRKARWQANSAIACGGK
jgi:hypothetical protein